MTSVQKAIVWAVCVGIGLAVWQFNAYLQARPSGVVVAEIVEVSGCGAILDFDQCATVVDIGGVRLRRGGNFGAIGDSLLVTQGDSYYWRSPTARQMEKYRAEQARGQRP